jgi:hypothetical protein
MRDGWRRRDKHQVAASKRNCARSERSFYLGIQRISEPWARTAVIFRHVLLDLHTRMESDELGAAATGIQGGGGGTLRRL